MRKLLLILLLSAWGCDCGTGLRQIPECQVHPEDPTCQPMPPPASCGTGKVSGVICAPDAHTSVAGATVTVSGSCGGKAFSVKATTDSTGHFTLTAPPGTWTLTATSGSFKQSFNVTVKTGQTTQASMDQQYCFKADTTKLAVISGSGDHIETLLQQIGFTPTVIDGTTTGFDGPSGGLQFLKDPAQLSQYNVLFIDCAAGRTPVTQSNGKNYNEFDFGSDAQTIANNLKQFVQKGGSLYASDWAFIYIYLGWGQEFDWLTSSGTTGTNNVMFPFDPYDMMGYKNQTVMADVVDTGLAGYLGKTTVPITFPSNMNHWGLMDPSGTTATTLISAAVAPCSDSSCSNAGGVNTAPLAALYRVLPNGPGGAVAYTSFHNIDQTDPTDVENILKYLIFKL